uniref:Ubiquitin-like protease family profile domain-containing protein n=1 Tax=Erpetoichthys calabaricus TaxID=27687 RepID=A0A8C4TF49_ERPCA
MWNCLTSLQNVKANRISWGFMLHPMQEKMIRFVMDTKLSQAERLLEVGGVWLTRSDFKTIGPESWMESTIGNACLVQQISSLKGKDIYMGDLYVTATWGPPRNLDPLQSLPANSHMKDALVIPIWTPSRHYRLCGLQSQMNSNDCGTFMLMYLWRQDCIWLWVPVFETFYNLCWVLC